MGKERRLMCRMTGAMDVATSYGYGLARTRSVRSAFSEVAVATSRSDEYSDGRRAVERARPVGHANGLEAS